MRLSRLLLVLVLAGLAIVLFREAQATYRQEDADPSRIVLLFGALVIVGAAGGVLIVVTVLPLLGDALGNVFFQPNQAPPPSPHAGALAAMARGDYPAAIEAFRAAFEADPQDTCAVSEMVRIYCEKLRAPAPAAELLERTLAMREWPPDQSTFLRMRLAEVRWKHEHDARAAREILLGIIADYPATPHAANATHKLQEIGREIALEG